MNATPTRGGHILDAALTVIAEQGYDSLSMRAVAAEAGVSLAQVQYYFRSRAELIAAAYEHASNQFVASLRVVGDGARTLARLRSILWLWLPLDLERDRRARTWLAYAAAAVNDAELATASAQIDDELRAWFADELDVLQQAGELPVGLGASHAPQLLALVDGVVLHCLTLAMDDREGFAESTLGNWLTRNEASLAAAPGPRRVT